jgi:hypothetical protein
MVLVFGLGVGPLVSYSFLSFNFVHFLFLLLYFMLLSLKCSTFFFFYFFTFLDYGFWYHRLSESFLGILKVTCTMKHMLKHHVNTNALPFHSNMRFIELLLK